MSRPLYVNDFGFYCILGGDKETVFQKLTRGERGNFTMHDVAGVMRPAATIEPDTMTPVENPEFDNRVNRLSCAALDQIEPTVRKAIEKFGDGADGFFLFHIPFFLITIQR